MKIISSFLVKKTKEHPPLANALPSLYLSRLNSFVKRGVERVEILLVELILCQAKGVGETINMKYFTYTL